MHYCLRRVDGASLLLHYWRGAVWNNGMDWTFEPKGRLDWAASIPLQTTYLLLGRASIVQTFTVRGLYFDRHRCWYLYLIHSPAKDLCRWHSQPTSPRSRNMANSSRVLRKDALFHQQPNPPNPTVYPSPSATSHPSRMQYSTRTASPYRHLSQFRNLHFTNSPKQNLTCRPSV